jgi:hypothetical protein
VPDPAEDKILDRLRQSGLIPRFSKPAERKYERGNGPLDTPPAPPRRQVGRRMIEGETGVRS